MPTRNVVLTAHHERVIETLVGSGRYQNASEVLREGLRLIEQRETREIAKLKALQEAAQVGFSDLDQGRYRDLQNDDLEDLISSLGVLAGDRVRKARR
jgi:antitoxin ParD1/3/4